MRGDEITLNRMKTLIRSKTTGKYLEANGSWTSDLAHAFGFADTQEVISAVQIHKLMSIEMVILMGDNPGKYDAVVGLTDFQRTRPTPGDGTTLAPPNHRE